MREAKQNIIIVLLNIAVAVMALFSVAAAYYTYDEVHDYLIGPAMSADSCKYAVEDGRYSYLLERYHDNTAVDKETTKSVEEYYAVARYFEAASYRKAFAETGDAERTARYAEKMAEAEKEMGALTPVKDKILETLAFSEGIQ